jgi:ketosteroid isomerase-like protein
MTGVFARHGAILCAAVLLILSSRAGAEPQPQESAQASAQAAALAGIAQTMSRYCQATDESDPAMLLDTFTPDAVLVASIASGNAKPVPELKSAQAIVDFIMEGRKKQKDVRRHFLTNYWLEKLDGSQATVQFYFLIVVTSPDGQAQAKSTGRYRSDMVRGADGIWRIRHETVLLDGPY